MKIIDDKNKHRFWRQGCFVDQKQYRNWTPEDKERADSSERHLVRPSPTGNAICRCNHPEEAKWIAERLNLASKLEQSLSEDAEDAEDAEVLDTIDKYKLVILYSKSSNTFITKTDTYENIQADNIRDLIRKARNNEDN